VAALAAGAVLLLAGSGRAGLLQPQPIDANTGDDALGVGAAFGSRQAWAGFEQPATAMVTASPSVINSRRIRSPSSCRRL